MAHDFYCIFYIVRDVGSIQKVGGGHAFRGHIHMQKGPLCKLKRDTLPICSLMASTSIHVLLQTNEMRVMATVFSHNFLASFVKSKAYS